MKVPEADRMVLRSMKETLRARDAGSLDGYITPDGEYVRLDDLKGMERSLRRLYGDDDKEVRGGLRGVSLELAKERRDAAESFRRARALGPGDGRAKRYLAMVEERLRDEAGMQASRPAN